MKMENHEYLCEFCDEIISGEPTIFGGRTGQSTFCSDDCMGEYEEDWRVQRLISSDFEFRMDHDFSMNY